MNSFNLRKMYDKFITQLHTQFETYNNVNLKYQYFILRQEIDVLMKEFQKK